MGESEHYKEILKAAKSGRIAAWLVYMVMLLLFIVTWVGISTMEQRIVDRLDRIERKLP